MGEPAGVGAELTIKAWLARRADGVPFFALDDPARLAQAAGRLAAPVPVQSIMAPADVGGIFSDALPVWPVALAAPVVPGQPSVANAAAVIASIKQAVSFALTGEAAGVVTNPIDKRVLRTGGFLHQGHTDFLGTLAADGGTLQTVMMLACAKLRVVPITVHLPLKEVPAALSTEAIITQGRIVASALKRFYNLPKPRLAVCGLNPHAGEGGVMGDEDVDIITPAIKVLRSDGLSVAGPAAADSLFHPQARKKYDVAVCMYHDQALIPIKTVDFYGGVNITLGLPFVRTSPDHGVAYNIAADGIACADSFRAAMREAARMAAAAP